MRLLGTPANFKWSGDAIYIGLKLEVAIQSRWAHFYVGVSSSDARPSVKLLTLSSKLAVELLT